MTDEYQKVREGHRFDLLERGFQSVIERNSSHTSVSALVEDKCLNHFKNILKKKRSSINFGHIFDFSFSKETEASY